jgi:ATP-binding cassette subfamily A (ABC1) protein 3
LDEAEYLADQMIIIFKGRLKAEGSTSELKARLGNGYRFSVPPGTDDTHDQLGPVAVSSKLHAEETFSTTDTATAMEKIKSYQKRGIKNYQIAGPTIEEIFMKLAVDETHDNVDPEELSHDESSQSPPTPQTQEVTHEKKRTLVTVKSNSSMLLTGHHTGNIRQAFILFRKRIKILRWTWVSYLAVVAIPIIAAGMVSILLNDFKNPGCDFIDQISLSDRYNLSDDLTPQLLVGPPTALTEQKINLFSAALTDLSQSSEDGPNSTALVDSVHLVNNLDEFNDFVKSNYSTIVPGGLYLGNEGSVPTFGYRSDYGTLGIYSAVFIQNAMDIFLTNQTIATQYCKPLESMHFIRS